MAVGLGRPGHFRGAAAAGVTYVELMLAVMVMAVLATLALPTGMKVHRRGQEAELQFALAKLRAAIDEYHRDWELGYIESDHEHGWPETLEELTEEIEYHGPLPGAAAPPPAGGPGGLGTPLPGVGGAASIDSGEPRPKIYLRRIPADPFNTDGDEWDVSGWRARSYEDDADSSSWDGQGVYDVYSSADWLAMDGLSRYEDW